MKQINNPTKRHYKRLIPYSLLLNGETSFSRMEQLEVNANTQLFSLHKIFERFIDN